MRWDIDYVTYDPANYKQDHPDDPLLIKVRGQAETLAAQISESYLREPKSEQAHYVDQGFEHFALDQHDLLEKYQLGQLEALPGLFLAFQEKALLAKEREFLATHNDPTDQVIYRHNMNSQLRAIEASVSEGSNKDYNDIKEQLEHSQGAQKECVLAEIHQVHERVFKELGLNREVQQQGLDEVQTPLRRGRGRDDDRER